MNKIEMEIQKDLDAGKFGFICSNETNFNTYVFKKLDEAKKQAITDFIKEIETLITDEILICHKENTPTSRLTSLIMKLKAKKFN